MLIAHFLSVDAKSFVRPAASPTKNEALLSKSDAYKMLAMQATIPVPLTYLNTVFCKNTFELIPHPWHRFAEAIFGRRSEYSERYAGKLFSSMNEWIREGDARLTAAEMIGIFFFQPSR
jgi:hypothetical protein